MAESDNHLHLVINGAGILSLGFDEQLLLSRDQSEQVKEFTIDIKWHVVFEEGLSC